MRRKESSREKMGCFRERIPNRLSCNGGPVIGNCSIMRMPGKMAVMTAMITFRGKGEKEEEDSTSWHAVAKPIRPLTPPLRPRFVQSTLKKSHGWMTACLSPA